MQGGIAGLLVGFVVFIPAASMGALIGCLFGLTVGLFYSYVQERYSLGIGFDLVLSTLAAPIFALAFHYPSIGTVTATPMSEALIISTASLFLGGVVAGYTYRSIASLSTALVFRLLNPSQP